MRRFLIFILILSSCPGTSVGQLTARKATYAQQIPGSTVHKILCNDSLGNFAYPVLNVAGLYAANFGEMRPGHFHAGVDIKTDGAIGRPIVAVADGCITRITLSPGGYGRALYLRLNDGSTAVYGHLSQFRDDQETRIQAERLRSRANSADLRFGIGEYPARRGETIALSGNSGSSFGPHLHFELRDPAGRLLNLVKEGMIRPQDNIPPVIMRLHYIEVDSLQGVAVQRPRQTYNVGLVGGGRYRLLHEGSVATGRKGYFVLEASDRRNGVQNTFGIYRASMDIDGEACFEYRMDGFASELSRCCDAVSYYPLQIASRNEVIRLAQIADAPDCFYTAMKERGLVRTAEDQTRRIRIETEDDCGNRSELEFDIKGRKDTFHTEADTTATLLQHDRTGTVRVGQEFTARIPAGALYEPIFCHPRQCDPQQAPAGVIVLSPDYQVFDCATPLRTNMTVSIRAQVPENLRKHTTLAVRATGGGLSCLGGKYTDGVTTTNTRTSGQYLVAADTVAPRITPLFKEKTDLTGSRSLRFKIKDNFSGIGTCTLQIDGEWVPCDRFPLQSTLIHQFTTSAARKKHEFRLTVGDACGNTATIQGTFYR